MTALAPGRGGRALALLLVIVSLAAVVGLGAARVAAAPCDPSGQCGTATTGGDHKAFAREGAPSPPAPPTVSPAQLETAASGLIAAHGGVAEVTVGAGGASTQYLKDEQPCAGIPIITQVCSGIGWAWEHTGAAVIGGAVGGIGGAIVGAVTDWVVQGAVWILGQVAGVFDNASTPDLNAQWFHADYQTMAMISAALLALMFLLALAQGLLRRDPVAVLKAAFVSLPLAMGGTVAAIAFTNRAIHITDDMTSVMSAHLHDTLTDLGHKLAEAITATRAIGGGMFVAFVVAAVTVLVSLLIWFELLFREAALYVCVLFLPLAIAVAVWPAAARLLRRLMQTLMAVILSKFVIVSVLTLAISALGSKLSDGGPSAMVVGVLMLALAAYAPYKLMRLMPAMETAGGGAASRVGARVLRVVSRSRSSTGSGDLAAGMVRGRTGRATGVAGGGTTGGVAAGGALRAVVKGASAGVAAGSPSPPGSSAKADRASPDRGGGPPGKGGLPSWGALKARKPGPRQSTFRTRLPSWGSHQPRSPQRRNSDE